MPNTQEVARYKVLTPEAKTPKGESQDLLKLRKTHPEKALIVGSRGAIYAVDDGQPLLAAIYGLLDRGHTFPDGISPIVDRITGATKAQSDTSPTSPTTLRQEKPSRKDQVSQAVRKHVPLATRVAATGILTALSLNTETQIIGNVSANTPSNATDNGINQSVNPESPPKLEATNIQKSELRVQTTNYTVESVALSGNDQFAMIAILSDNKRHLVIGNLTDASTTLKDMGTLPIEPTKVARYGEIVVAVGNQLSNPSEGAIWYSTNGGKTGRVINDSFGSFLSVSTPDDQKVFLFQRNKTLDLENIPARYKVLDLQTGQLTTLNTSFVSTQENSSVMALSAEKQYRFVGLDYRYNGYLEYLVNFNNNTITTNRVTQGENNTYLYDPPIQFTDKDGDLATLVFRESVPHIPPNPEGRFVGTMIYNKNNTVAYRIQPYWPLFSDGYPVYPRTAVFNKAGEGYIGAYRGDWDPVELKSYTTSFIIKLGADLADFTTQQIIGDSTNGLPKKEVIKTLHLVENNQGKKMLVAEFDSGLYVQQADGTFSVVPIQEQEKFKVFLPLTTSHHTTYSGW